MGFSLEVCGNCLLPDSDVNMELNEDTNQYKHKINCVCRSDYKGLKYDELYELLESKIKSPRRYISSRTLLIPSDTKIVRKYLNKFKLLKPRERIYKSIVWDKFFNSIDFIIKEKDNPETEEYKNILNFINDLIY